MSSFPFWIVMVVRSVHVIRSSDNIDILVAIGREREVGQDRPACQIGRPLRIDKLPDRLGHHQVAALFTQAPD